MNQAYTALAAIAPKERVLLLSYCLRPSQVCPGKLTKQGLVCPADCQEQCVVGRLQRAALALGYKGVCIAAGGSMAIRYVRESRPRGIVAVACDKELAEGVEAVRKLTGDGQCPAIVVVPLLSDGCIDTLVDEDQALTAIRVGQRNTEVGKLHET